MCFEFLTSFTEIAIERNDWIQLKLVVQSEAGFFHPKLFNQASIWAWTLAQNSSNLECMYISQNGTVVTNHRVK